MLFFKILKNWMRKIYGDISFSDFPLQKNKNIRKYDHKKAKSIFWHFFCENDN